MVFCVLDAANCRSVHFPSDLLDHAPIGHAQSFSFVHLGNHTAMLGPINLAAVTPIGMLVLSNIFMTFAWYGHLKHKTTSIAIAILVSWGIAFFEYCLAVPANRMGSNYYSTAQLKTIQEVVTLVVFAGFSVFWLKESLTFNHAIGFALIALGASFIFRS
jgi:uncharacterized protein (DUF486 family)